MGTEARVLIVDLSASSHRVESLPDRVTADFLGGRGLGAYLLAQHLTPGIDPLSPNNPLIFSVGPAQGTNAFYSSRAVLTTKSPLTGIYLYSVASGTFGQHLRKAGYWAILITGRASEPSYISVANDSVEVRLAPSVWGQKTLDAHNALIASSGHPDAACAVIGPSGEKLIKMAAVVTEGEQTRTFGRGGGGCVMGAKNLKGVVVYGDKSVPIANEGQLSNYRQLIAERVKENKTWAQEWRQWGTGGGLATLSSFGILPTRNWQTGVYEDLEKINGPTAPFEGEREHMPCAPFCPSPCSHISRVTGGKYRGAWSAGPEYETLYSFGSDCGVTSLEAIVAAERLCDDYGLDTMSAGIAIGFAMECFEKGLLTKADTGGLELRFGQHEAMLDMLQQMADKKEGLPSLLVEGVRRAAQEIPGSDAFAMHAKGMELGGYECRGSYGQALEFVLSPRGGCHHAFSVLARAEQPAGTGVQIQGKGQMLKRFAINRILQDCAIVCGFGATVLKDDLVPALFSALSAHPRGASDLATAAMRVITMERMINVREGITRQDDTLPRRLLEEPLPDGPNKGNVVQLEALKDEAYTALGWDLATGVPTKALLTELGLEGMVQRGA